MFIDVFEKTLKIISHGFPQGICWHLYREQ